MEKRRSHDRLPPVPGPDRQGQDNLVHLSKHGTLLPGDRVTKITPKDRRTELSPKESIAIQRYYHPNLKTKEEVKEFMKSAKPGQFILRDSFTEQGCYTFSVMHQTGLKHLKLDCHGGRSFSLKDKFFPTIEELTNFYSSNSIPNREHLPDVYLSHPISSLPPSSRTTDDSWIYLNPLSSPSTGGATEPAAAEAREYAVVRDPDDSLKRVVMEQAKRMDRDSKDFCDCGLRVDETELPRGWSVHLSQDPDSLGKVYFMSPDDKSHWELPLHVLLDLSSDQQIMIRSLMGSSDPGRQRDSSTTHIISTTASGSSAGGNPNTGSSVYLTALPERDRDSACEMSTPASLSEDEGAGENIISSLTL